MNVFAQMRAKIDAEEKELLVRFDALQAKKDLLSEMEAMVGEPESPSPPATTPTATTPPAPEVPAGKPPPVAPRASPGGASERVAKALADGPLRVQQIALKTGASEAAVSALLKHQAGKLFEKVDPTNRFSPWRVIQQSPG